MISAAIGPSDDSVKSHYPSERPDHMARRWSCHVLVRVKHSSPLLAAGLLATLQQVPGYDVALADEASSAEQQAIGATHVLITDRPVELHHSNRRFAGAPGGRLPRPRVILLTSEPPLARCQNAQAGGVDVCLPMDCRTDDLLAAVRQLGHSALGPLTPPGEQNLPFDHGARSGLAPNVLRTVRHYIEGHLATGADLESLARVAGLSCSHFSRAFKRSTGMPAHHYLITRRVSAAIVLIRQTDRALSEIALEVGFADQSHFSRTFVQLTGLTPGEFRHRSR